MTKSIHAVTGAFSYSGRYITQRLLQAGERVITLTSLPHRTHPFPGKVQAFPFDFNTPDTLVQSLGGVSVLYNTYWVRFNHRSFSFATAIENSRRLFAAARRAGVKRIVHTSITNPSEDSSFEYFSGKAKVERALRESGLSYAILRPAVLFGKEDILINNIAWLLRRFPIFGIFGDGNYRLQPIYVDDLAKLAVEQGNNAENTTINAIGPETFTFRELVQQLGLIIGKPRPTISIPTSIGYVVSLLIGKALGDVFITRDEISGLMADLLCVDSPPTGSTKLTEWAQQNRSTLGLRYASELARRTPSSQDRTKYPPATKAARTR